MPSDNPSQLFGEYYYAHNCGAPYERTEAWLAFFDAIAARIVADFQPKTVLDAGCAKGFLVEGLRKRGVEAWGVDISEHAIQNVHESIKDFCHVGSLADPLADPLPRSYDLIISIEVVEHMPPEVATRAIENLCGYSDNILISSSPYDYKEATHINVHPPDYWARQFARHGFYRDLDYDATYITDWAARFYRVQGSAQPVIQDYERHFWQMKTELKELRSSVVEYHSQLEALKASNIEQRIREIENSRAWRIAQKIQALRVSLAPPGSQREKLLKKLRIFQ